MLPDWSMLMLQYLDITDDNDKPEEQRKPRHPHYDEIVTTAIACFPHATCCGTLDLDQLMRMVEFRALFMFYIVKEVTRFGDHHV